MIFILFVTGCRLAEIAGMQRGDIDLEAGYIKVRGKGKRNRLVAPGAIAMGALDQYLEDRDGPVWLNNRGGQLTRMGFYYVIYRLGKRASVHAFPHRFRTTFAHLFDERAKDPHSLQLLMGHARLATTLHYLEWGAADRALEKQRGIELLEEYAG